MSGDPRMLRAFVICIAFSATAMGQNADPATQQAQDLLRAGKTSEARDAFEAILRATPTATAAESGEVAASERIALDLRAQGKMPEALETLMRAEHYAPDNARIAYDLGILEDEMHLYPEATASLEKAEKLGFGDPSLLYAEARVLIDRQQLQPAEDKMNEYLKVRPSDATAWYGLGRVYQLGVEFDKAKQAFQESVRLQPDQTEGWFQLGDIALKQNQEDEALADFTKTLARNPQHGGALAGAGEACFQEKRYQQALDYLNRAVAAAPDYGPGHYYLGLTLGRLGRKDESQRELATAAKLADAENRKSSTRYQITTPDAPQ